MGAGETLGIQQVDYWTWNDFISDDAYSCKVVTFYISICPYCDRFQKEFIGAVNDDSLEEENVKFGVVDAH